MKRNFIEAKYKGYLITGNRETKFVCVAPYGKFSPKAYDTLKQCKAAINADLNTIQGGNK